MVVHVLAPRPRDSVEMIVVPFPGAERPCRSDLQAAHHCQSVAARRRVATLSIAGGKLQVVTATCAFNSLCRQPRPPRQLRQLGDVGGDAPPARHVLGVLSARMRKSFSS
jgi:hypothetical protein